MSGQVVDRAALGEVASVAPAACLFRSLGDPARLAILRHLAALVIAAVAVKEGRQAWRGDDCCGPAAGPAVSR